MKELSIEEKARAHDEALERYKAKQEYESQKVREFIEYLFPELAESEDKRVRKAIINIIGDIDGDFQFEKYGILKKDALAWLEKEAKGNEREIPNSEQKPADKVEPKFKVGDVVTNKKSKDTVKIVQILHDSYCYSGWDGAATVHSDFSISEQDDWELVEQNPVWSEEDENNILFLTSIIEECFKDKEKITLCADTVCANFTKENVIDRLKSLRPHNTWKPSDEQMNALRYVTNFDYGGYKATLVSLYEQLKKLKG